MFTCLRLLLLYGFKVTFDNDSSDTFTTQLHNILLHTLLVCETIWLDA